VRVTADADSLFPVAGTFEVDAVTLIGGHQLPDLNYQAVRVELANAGTLSLVARLDATDLEVLRGDLRLAGHTLSANNVATDGPEAFITMTNAADTLITTSFTGGGTGAGRMTAGLLIAHGSIGGAFVATGTHVTRLDGGIPQLADGHFQELELVNPGTEPFGLSSGGGLIVVDGTLTVADAGIKLTDITMVARTVDVAELTLSNAPLTVDGGTIVKLDNVALVNFPDSVAQLTIRLPGSAGTFTLNGFTFSSTPVTGFYVDAVDTDGAAPALNILIHSNLTNAQGSAFTRTNTGPGPVQAVVTWP
jgi:hypothetical protein